MSFHIAIVEHTVVVVAACARVVHHAREVGAQDIAVGLTSVRRFLDVLAVLFPSTEEEHRGVTRRVAGIAVNGIEEVGSPGVGQVGALLQAHDGVLVLAGHFDEFGRRCGVFKKVLARGKSHSQHFLGLAVAIEALVFASGVSRVDPELEITPILFFLGIGAHSHAAECGHDDEFRQIFHGRQNLRSIK